MLDDNPNAATRASKGNGRESGEDLLGLKQAAPPARKPRAPSRRVKILLAAVSMFIAFVLGEVALHVALPVERVVGRGVDDASWEYMWVRQRPQNRDTGRLTEGNPLMEFSPTLGWRPRPFAERDSFRLNSRGLRGGREYPLQKAPGEKRVVVVGDSYTFAGRYTPELPAIPDDSIYTALVEKEFPKTTVINLGVPGYGTDQMLLYFREEGVQYHPDVVLLTLYIDNPYRTLLNFRDYKKPRFDLEDGRLVLRNVPLPPPEELEKELSGRPPLLYSGVLLHYYLRKLAGRLAPMGSLEVDRLNFAILDAFAEDCRKQQARLLVVVIPFEVIGTHMHRSEEIVQDWGRRSGTPVLLLREPFLALPPTERDKLYIGHLTPYGHEVTARAVAGKIRELRLLE